MQIENFRIWHWMTAGIITGLLFSLVLWFAGPWFDNAPLETLPPGEIDWYVLYDRRPPIQGWQFRNGGKPQNDPLRREQQAVASSWATKPLLKDVVVHPAPATDKGGQWWVTGKYLTLKDDATDPKHPGQKFVSETWTPFKAPAGAPYLPMYHSSHHELIQKELDQLLKDQEEAKAAGKELASEKRIGIRDRKEEMDFDAKLQKDLGGADSFANVGDFLKFAATKEPERKFTFSYAWYDSKVGVWTMPPLAGLFIIGFGGMVMVNILQAMGLAAMPTATVKAVAKPKLVAKPVTGKRPVPVATTGVATVVTPPPQRPMTEAEKKEYGGEFYPVVKTTTHKETH